MSNGEGIKPKKSAEYHLDYLAILADTPASTDQIARAIAMGHSATMREIHAGKTVEELLSEDGTLTALGPQETTYGRPDSGDQEYMAIRAAWLAAHPDAPHTEKIGHDKALRAVMTRAAVQRMHAALTEQI